MSTQTLSRPKKKPSFQPQPAQVRRLQASDRAPLSLLVRADGLFTADEVAVALELLDAAIAEPGGEYRALVAELDGEVAGYICYGPTPMTEGTWDLYWIVSHPQARGRGVGKTLVARMETELREIGARLVRVETSQQESYGAAHTFYERLGYPVAARFTDFYKPGDDLVVMMKRL